MITTDARDLAVEKSQTGGLLNLGELAMIFDIGRDYIAGMIRARFTTFSGKTTIADALEWLRRNPVVGHRTKNNNLLLGTAQPVTKPGNLTEMTKQSAEQIKVKKWLALRKKAGRKIDPETAEVFWTYGQDFDPYGVDPELPEECDQIGRVYFARSPGSNIWLWFGDLPTDTSDALWEKHKASLAFPAGLF